MEQEKKTCILVNGVFEIIVPSRPEDPLFEADARLGIIKALSHLCMRMTEAELVFYPVEAEGETRYVLSLGDDLRTGVRVIGQTKEVGLA